MPHDPFHRGPQISWFGVLMVVVGVWWLLDILEIINVPALNWAIVGALALVAIGLSMVVGRLRWGGRFG